MGKQKCIYIDEAQRKWLKQQGYSASRILRKAIKNLMLRGELEDYDDRIRKLANLVEEMSAFLEERGLTNEFLAQKIGQKSTKS